MKIATIKSLLMLKIEYRKKVAETITDQHLKEHVEKYIPKLSDYFETLSKYPDNFEIQDIHDKAMTSNCSFEEFEALLKEHKILSSIETAAIF